MNSRTKDGVIILLGMMGIAINVSQVDLAGFIVAALIFLFLWNRWR